MTGKDLRIAETIAKFQGRDLEAHYLAFFECFNRQLFFEAHEVLEPLWLARRQGPAGPFYKGLIQLAGAFVHLQKNRLSPAGALFRLAGANFEKCPDTCHLLDVEGLRRVVEQWLGKLEAGASTTNPLPGTRPPELRLLGQHG